MPGLLRRKRLFYCASHQGSLRQRSPWNFYAVSLQISKGNSRKYIGKLLNPTREGGDTCPIGGSVKKGVGALFVVKRTI